MSSVIVWDHKLSKAVGSARMQRGYDTSYTTIDDRFGIPTDVKEFIDMLRCDELFELEDGVIYYIHLNGKW